ncbi:class I SAM-dependent methyltransferase [Candidatus Uhrbacteria bacterium]|nr:class I SAM-dependent methyltransferase [Candidatus Uhrbacteria bacterium]
MAYFIFIVIAFALLGSFAYAGLRGAPWVPTWGVDVERFLKLANIQPGQKMYDLGCGDGRIVSAAARVGARAQGFEVSLLPYLLARARNLLSPKKNRFALRYKDFWYADLHDADVVYVFLMQKIYPRLKEKLEKELRPGAKVITYVWPIPGWTPTTTDTKANQPPLFLYER